MIKINKDERDYLLSHGCEWHMELNKTVHHYYACECDKVLTLLNQFREGEEGND